VESDVVSYLGLQVVLPGDSIGNEDIFFAHMTGGSSMEVAVPETDMARIALGLQLAENGAGLIFIRGCPDGTVHRQLKYLFPYPCAHLAGGL